MKNQKTKTTKKVEQKQEPVNETAAVEAAAKAATYAVLTAFFSSYDALKKQHDSQQITDGAFVVALISLTATVKPPKKKKEGVKEPPKYKRITVEQFEEYEQLKAK